MRSLFAKRLQEALRKKEEVEGFQANLQRLKEAGTVSQQHYDLMMEVYNKNLAEALKELSELQVAISQELERNQRDLAVQQEELAKLEVRQKVGELTQPQFESASRLVRKRVQALEASVALGRGLLETKSSPNLAFAAGHASNPAPIAGVLRSPRSWLPDAGAFTEFTSVEEMTTPRFKALGLLGGILLLISVLAKWVRSEKWATVTGPDVSVWLLVVGLLGAAGAVYAGLLARPKARGVLHLVIATLALIILLVVFITYSFGTVKLDLGGMTLEMPRGAIHFREGFYLYIVSIALMIAYSLGEIRAGD